MMQENLKLYINVSIFLEQSQFNFIFRHPINNETDEIHAVCLNGRSHLHGRWTCRRPDNRDKKVFKQK